MSFGMPVAFGVAGPIRICNIELIIQNHILYYQLYITDYKNIESYSIFSTIYYIMLLGQYRIQRTIVCLAFIWISLGHPRPLGASKK